MVEASYINGHVVLQGVPKGALWLVAEGHHQDFTGRPHEVGESSSASVAVPEGPVSIRIRAKRRRLLFDAKFMIDPDTIEVQTSDLPISFRMVGDVW